MATDNTRNDSASGPYKVNSLRIDPRADPMKGSVHWDPARSIWNGGMLLATLILGPAYFSWSALVLYVVLLELTMCMGHSVGFHRRLIHRTFQCPRRVERTLVWMGTLVGMQPDCHPYLRHGQGMLKDAWWNLHCRLKLDNPPGFGPGPGIGDDRFYRILQRTWMAQQIPVAALLFAIGGMPWLVWGVCARVATGVSMHWAAIPSMGESWHNNHHAFPASARHGLYPGQIDIGYGLVRVLERFGLASAVQTPESLPVRQGVTPVVTVTGNAVGRFERSA